MRIRDSKAGNIQTNFHANDQRPDNFVEQITGEMNPYLQM
jgi:hypothetical protein